MKNVIINDKKWVRMKYRGIRGVRWVVDSNEGDYIHGHIIYHRPDHVGLTSQI